MPVFFFDVNNSKTLIMFEQLTQLIIFTCSKSIIEIVEKDLKYVQS